MRRCRAHCRARKAHTLHTITHTWRLHAGKFIRLLRALFFHENGGQVKILKMTAFFGFVIFFMVCWLRFLHRGHQRRYMQHQRRVRQCLYDELYDNFIIRDIRLPKSLINEVITVTDPIIGPTLECLL